MARPLDTPVRVRVNAEDVAALQASAEQDDRSLSAEVRLAIKNHLAKNHLARRVLDAEATEAAP